MALPWTGSGEPINGIVGASGTGEAVGCVSTSWTWRSEGDGSGPIGSVVRTNDNSVGISLPGESVMWESVISAVSLC